MRINPRKHKEVKRNDMSVLSIEDEYATKDD